MGAYYSIKETEPPACGVLDSGQMEVGGTRARSYRILNLHACARESYFTTSWLAQIYLIHMYMTSICFLGYACYVVLMSCDDDNR